MNDVKTFFAILVLSGVSFSVTVDSCNDNITEVLTSPGLYELNQSVSGAPSVGFGPICIYIGSDDVDFNCNGFSITNNGSAAGTYGIFIDGAANNVTVRNCAGISGYEYGVLVDSVTNGSFTNNTISNNTKGIYVSASSDNLFGGNALDQNSEYGIALNLSSDNNLTGNTATDNGIRGFFVLFSNNTMLNDNFASGSQFGFYTYFSPGTQLDGNNATLASDTGILLNSVNGGTLTLNRAFDNTIGYSLSATANTNLTLNMAYENSFNGFYVHTGSFGNTLDSNEAFNNTGAGFHLAFPSLNNTLIGNSAYNNSGSGFLLEGSTGNNLSGNSALDNSVGFLVESGSDDNDLEGNLAQSNSNGFQIDSSSGNVLTSNLADDNVFDTFSLSDADGNAFFGNTGSLGFDAFALSGSDSNIFIGNNATGHTFDGFRLFNSTGNGFLGNTASGGFDGFNLANSDNNVFVANGASGYTFDGFFAYNSTNSTLEANSFSGGFSGISLSSSAGGTLIDNVASGGSSEGISLSSSDDATLSGNTVSGYSTGVDIFNSTGAQLSNEHYYDNGADLEVIGNGTTLSLSGVVFDSTGGAFTDYTNLSLSDTLSPPVSGYTIDHATDPGSIPADLFSFEQKFVDITNTTPGLSIESVIWHWDDSELSGYNESRFLLYKFNSSGWANMNAAIDTGANTLSLAGLDPQSVFAILQNNATESTPPNVTLVSPPNDTSLTAPATVFFRFNATDNLDSFFSCFFVLDGLPNQTNPATANNTITTFSVSGFSEGAHTWAVQCSDNASNVGVSETWNFFVNLTAPPPSDGGGDGGGAGGGDPLSLSVNSTFDGNIVTVTSDGSPVPGANVLVDGLSVGLTNSSGQVMFPGCSDTVVVKAKKDGYQDAEMMATLSECPACTVNTDCPATMQCSENQCVPVPCACGTVQDHQCVAFQCCADTDCPSGQACVGNSCVEPSGCSSDSDCADTQFCDMPAGASSGSCEDVQPGACGQVSNHAFVPYGYECGTEPGCPSCPSGQSCLNHECVAAPADLSCPSSGTVGSSAGCTATNCANCDYEVTAPDGTKTSGKTGADGKLALALGQEGVYKVTLFRDGQAVETLEVRALPGGVMPGEQPPTAAGGDLLLPILLVLALIIVGGVLYWRSRKR